MSSTGLLFLAVVHGVLELPALASRHEVRSSAAQQGAISPKLEPESDRRFFRKDYPDDYRPAPTLHHVKTFDHPYPVVQDHETYDKDFVKDENNDNGEWEAQMEYDTLRNKLRGQQRAVNDAYRKEQEEQHSLDGDGDAEFKASEAERRAKEAAEKAGEDAAKAHDDVEKLVGKGAANGGKDVGGAMGDAIDNVKDRMKHLKDCQKQLVDAKAQLKDLMGQKEKLLKEAEEAKTAKAAAKAAEQAKVDHENAEAKTKYDADIATAKGELKAVTADAKASHEALVGKEKELERKVREAEAAHAAALKAYREEQADIETTQSKLKEAAERVRSYRAGVDEEGGIYNVKAKSSGSRPVSRTLLTAALLLVPLLPSVA